MKSLVITLANLVLLNTIISLSGAVPCGWSPFEDAGSPFIVGGKKARPHEFPWVMSIRYGMDHESAFCGGSLITPQWVLTAAHCIHGDYPSWLVVVGGEHHVRDDDSKAREFLWVEKVVWHEEYGKNATSFDHDIALLKLKSPVNVSSQTIGTVCLPEPEKDYTGSTCQTMGWGNTLPVKSGVVTMSGSWVPGVVLQWTSLPLLSDVKCSDVMPITENMICAGRSPEWDRDTCQGDSGGPLTIKNDQGFFEVIGITSWGYGCASGTPGVYTKVQNYLSWIQDKINQ